LQINEHTSAMLEFAAIVTPMFLACIGGIVSIYSRLSKLETLITAERKLTNEQFASRDNAIELLADNLRHAER
jgi:hypothetical protein